MKLEFRYGIKYEVQRVKETLSWLDWFYSQGYEVTLPKGVDKDSTSKTIKETIAGEFNKEEYEKVRDKLLADFSKVGEKFSKKVKRIFGRVPNTIVVYLTKYGCGGSYMLPNKVVINIRNEGRIETLIHEIVHILIQKYVEKYKISHWEKERIVDLIVNSGELGLGFNDWQKEYGGEQYIDKLFKKYFFVDPELFFSKVRSYRHRT